MHQAALRVHDRSWLYTFSHVSKPAIAHPTQPLAEPKINTPTPVEAISENITTETPTPVIETPALVETEAPAPIVEPIGKTESIIPVAEPTVKVATEIPTPITPLPVARPFVSDPKRVQLKNERPPLFTPERGQVYDLERIFSEKQPVKQEPHKGKASTDFYAWLNTTPPKAIPPNVIAAEPKQVPLPEIPESIAQQKSIIENFLINKPSISRPKQEFFKPEKAQKKGEILSGAIVTETLARIYLKQDNPQKAIWAYQQLQLKFPEKKTYFANLISQIETEQNKS